MALKIVDFFEKLQFSATFARRVAVRDRNVENVLWTKGSSSAFAENPQEKTKSLDECGKVFAS